MGNTWAAPPSLTAPQQQEARRRRADGATLKELAKSYNVQCRFGDHFPRRERDTMSAENIARVKEILATVKPL